MSVEAWIALTIVTFTSPSKKPSVPPTLPTESMPNWSEGKPRWLA